MVSLEYGYLIVGLMQPSRKEQVAEERSHERNHNKTNRQGISPICKERPVRISYEKEYGR